MLDTVWQGWYIGAGDDLLTVARIEFLMGSTHGVVQFLILTWASYLYTLLRLD